MYSIINFILTFLENREDKKNKKRRVKIKRRVSAGRAMKSRFRNSPI